MWNREQIRRMNVTITGASGHLGANLVRRLLHDGEKVTVLAYEDSPSLKGLDIREIPGNVLEPASLRDAFGGADIVYHLAAMITLRRTSDPVAHRVNVEGTRNVAAACRACNVQRLVYFSSIHAYSSYPRREPIDESRPLCIHEDTLPYDRSKAAAEQLVRSAIDDGLDAVILNPTGVIGPHDYEPSAMGRVLIDLRAGRFPVLLRGGFNWVDARDVADAAVRAAGHAAAGARYIRGGTYATLADIAAEIARTTRARVPKLELPLWAAYGGVPFTLLWARLTKSKPRMTLASLRALRHHRLVSHEKASRELGYAPRPLENTISDTLAWFDARQEA